jgi:hypothetical protein
MILSGLLFAFATAAPAYRACFDPSSTDEYCANMIFSTATTVYDQLIREGTFPKGSLSNGAADAFRHCYWTGVLTQILGDQKSKAISDLKAVNAGVAKQMDTYNHSQGIQIGKRTRRPEDVGNICKREEVS